jgi:hypothetical protein
MQCKLFIIHYCCIKRCEDYNGAKERALELMVLKIFAHKGAFMNPIFESDSCNVLKSFFLYSSRSIRLYFGRDMMSYPYLYLLKKSIGANQNILGRMVLKIFTCKWAFTITIFLSHFFLAFFHFSIIISNLLQDILIAFDGSGSAD